MRTTVELETRVARRLFVHSYGGRHAGQVLLRPLPLSNFTATGEKAAAAESTSSSASSSSSSPAVRVQIEARATAPWILARGVTVRKMRISHDSDGRQGGDDALGVGVYTEQGHFQHSTNRLRIYVDALLPTSSDSSSSSYASDFSTASAAHDSESSSSAAAAATAAAALSELYDDFEVRAHVSSVRTWQLAQPTRSRGSRRSRSGRSTSARTSARSASSAPCSRGRTSCCGATPAPSPPPLLLLSHRARATHPPARQSPRSASRRGRTSARCTSAAP